MQTVDFLIKNAWILTIDESFTQHECGALAVNGDSIVAVGPLEKICSEYKGREEIDATGKILMPGLINSHTHVPMTLLRGLADDLRLDVWLMGYIMPVEREFVSPDFVRFGTLLACAEMIKSGTTTFADMYYFEEIIAETTAESGMRALCGETILKFPSPDARFYEEALGRTREFVMKWKNHPLIVPVIAPHAPYTCTPQIFEACVAMAKEFDVPIHIHVAETKHEVDSIRSEHGMPVVRYLKKHGMLDTKMIAAHCVHIDEGEMRDFQKAGVGVAHNPSSNLKLASGMAPVTKMLELGVNVGIGTDGPASNNDLDMFEEIRLTALQAKFQSGDPTAIPARTAVYMATLGGARALHISHLTGSLEVGKKADLILVDIETLHNIPRFHRDPNSAYAQIVYAAKAPDVTDVIVNGKILMRNRNLLTLSEDELKERSKNFAKQVDAFLIKREKSILSKLIAIGGALEEESFEVQYKVKVKEVQPIAEALKKSEIFTQYFRHYRQFDTYFLFEDDEDRIRYREDEFIDEKGQVGNVRARLTLIGPARAGEAEKQVMVSRSRYLAPANNSPRFYREYFKPKAEREIEKDRLRYFIRFRGTSFYVNIDTFTKPELGVFLEVKSRTWSKDDADRKARLIMELIEFLGATGGERVDEDFVDMVAKL